MEIFLQILDKKNFVKVTELGASSIDLTILCYLKPVDYTNFSEVKQNLIFEIIKVVKKHSSDFAFPTRSVYIENSQ